MGVCVWAMGTGGLGWVFDSVSNRKCSVNPGGDI